MNPYTISHKTRYSSQSEGCDSSDLLSWQHPTKIKSCPWNADSMISVQIFKVSWLQIKFSLRLCNGQNAGCTTNAEVGKYIHVSTSRLAGTRALGNRAPRRPSLTDERFFFTRLPGRSRRRKKRKIKPWLAPVLFSVCVTLHSPRS